MNRPVEKRLAARAVELGNSGEVGAADELTGLVRSPSAQVRRLAASALGKLAGVAGADGAVSALLPCLRGPHPQVRQYAVKALSASGAAAEPALHDLRDIAASPAEKPYNQRDAARAVEVIGEALRIAQEQAERCCRRCGVRIDADEYARSVRAFQREYCDRCFDEV